MRSYTPAEFYETSPVGFTGDSSSLEQTLQDPKSNAVIQAAILQPTSDGVIADQFEPSVWGTVTAVRGAGRQQGFVSTPTKGIPNPLARALAQEVEVSDTQWTGKDLNAALEGPREAFYGASAIDIAQNVRDDWHAGPDNSDLLANEVTHLLLAKFGQEVGDQMTQNLRQGRRSFICRQLNWIGGYSVDWRGGSDIATASVEPNVMIGVLVLVLSNVRLAGNTKIYSAFGLTSLPDFRAGMAAPAEKGAQLLAPYAASDDLKRSYTSMCTEVTLKTLDTIQGDNDLQASIGAGYRDLLS